MIAITTNQKSHNNSNNWTKNNNNTILQQLYRRKCKNTKTCRNDSYVCWVKMKSGRTLFFSTRFQFNFLFKQNYTPTWYGNKKERNTINKTYTMFFINIYMYVYVCVCYLHFIAIVVLEKEILICIYTYPYIYVK